MWQVSWLFLLVASAVGHPQGGVSQSDNSGSPVSSRLRYPILHKQAVVVLEKVPSLTYISVPVVEKEYYVGPSRIFIVKNYGNLTEDNVTEYLKEMHPYLKNFIYIPREHQSSDTQDPTVKDAIDQEIIEDEAELQPTNVSPRSVDFPGFPKKPAIRSPDASLGRLDTPDPPRLPEGVIYMDPERGGYVANDF